MLVLRAGQTVERRADWRARKLYDLGCSPEFVALDRQAVLAHTVPGPEHGLGRIWLRPGEAVGRQRQALEYDTAVRARSGHKWV